MTTLVSKVPAFGLLDDTLIVIPFGPAGRVRLTTPFRTVPAVTSVAGEMTMSKMSIGSILIVPWTFVAPSSAFNVAKPAEIVSGVVTVTSTWPV